VEQGHTTAAHLATLRASIAHVGRPANSSRSELAVDCHLPGGRLALGASQEVVMLGTRLRFPEPLLTSEALSGVIGGLTSLVSAELERRAEGARRLDLTFERVDRTKQVICIGIARPNCHLNHLARLRDEQIERNDLGLGVKTMHLVALTKPLTSEPADQVGWSPALP
jgi:hypothetical protein